jgi:hypothetical protein
MSGVNTTTEGESNETNPVGADMSTLSPEDKSHVTLEAVMDVSELPEPVCNHLAERARAIEREFLDAMGRSSRPTWETIVSEAGHEQERVGLEGVVSLADATEAKRREAHQKATEYEQQFTQEVRSLRETHTS